MKIRVAALSVALAISSLIFTTAHAQGTTWKSSDGAMSISASTIDISSSKIIAKGSAYIKGVDKVTNRTFESNAGCITVMLFSAPGAKGGPAGLDLIKSADFSGSVKLVFTVKDQGNLTKTIANADNAIYNGIDKIAYLNGNVKITNENPSIFDTPALMTGDKATINLKPMLGPDEFRFRVESAPGVSRIEATPKAKDDGKK